MAALLYGASLFTRPSYSGDWHSDGQPMLAFRALDDHFVCVAADPAVVFTGRIPNFSGIEIERCTAIGALNRFHGLSPGAHDQFTGRRGRRHFRG